MSRALLVCPEPLARGRRAGIGIRFAEIARVLRGDGHSVEVISPDGGEIEGCSALATSPQSLLDATKRSDVAIVQGHVANELFAHGSPLPTVVDLYDPYIVENLHYYPSSGPEVFRHDHDTLMRSLARGDLFLCASQAQRLFYLGMLLAIGRLNPLVFERDPHSDDLVRIAPFGVQPPRARHAADLERPAILFGGIYDWYDPILAIEAVARVRASIPGVTLTFNTHPNADITPQGRTAEAMRYVRSHGFDDFVRFEPWVPYETRSSFFDRFAVALLTFPQSLETDLSMRTRVYDYLWAGLPIVSSSAPGTDEILRSYDAGTVVEGSADDLASALVSILRKPTRHTAMVAGAARFVADHQWERALEPLLTYCRAPRIDPDRDRFTSPTHVPNVPPSLVQRLRRKLGARR